MVNNRITNVEIVQTTNAKKSRVKFKVIFDLDGGKTHWVRYDAVDELEAFSKFTDFINYVFPEFSERESS